MPSVMRLARRASLLAARRLKSTSVEPYVPPPKSSSGSSSVSADGVTWKTVTLELSTLGLAGSAMAFFSNRAHQDNEATRRESRENNELTRRELREDMQILRHDVEKQFDRVDKQFERVDKQIEKVNARLGSIDTSLKEISESLAASKGTRR